MILKGWRYYGKYKVFLKAHYPSKKQQTHSQSSTAKLISKIILTWVSCFKSTMDLTQPTITSHQSSIGTLVMASQNQINHLGNPLQMNSRSQHQDLSEMIPLHISFSLQQTKTSRLRSSSPLLRAATPSQQSSQESLHSQLSISK